MRSGVGEQMISECVVPTFKHGGGGGVIMWGCFAGDTVSDLFRIQGTLKTHKDPPLFKKILPKMTYPNLSL